MTAALTVSPSTPAPSTNVTLVGSGLADLKTRLLQNGTVVSTNECSLPTGTFTKIVASSSSGTDTYTVEQYSAGTWTDAGVTASAVVTVPATLPPSTGSYPTERASGILTTGPSSQSMPGYLVEITDTNWATKLRRISNTNGYRNSYPRRQPWSKNGTYAHFNNPAGAGSWRLLNGSTYADLGAAATGVEYPLWSNITDDRMYGCSDGSNIIKRYSASGNAWTNHATLGSYGHLSLGDFEDNLSDSDHAALIANSLSNRTGTWSIVVVNMTAGTVISSATIPAEPNNCAMSRDGNYVIVVYNSTGTGTNQGTRLYNAADMSLVRQISTGNSHGDPGRDAAGNQIYVHLNGGVLSHALAAGTSTTLLSSPNVFQLGHVSCTNYDRPGYAYLSYGTTKTDPGHGLLIAVKTDGSAHVEVYGSHHAETTGGDYDYTPFAAASRDGARVMFGSAWTNGAAASGSVYAYVAGVTT